MFKNLDPKSSQIPGALCMVSYYRVYEQQL